MICKNCDQMIADDRPHDKCNICNKYVHGSCANHCTQCSNVLCDDCSVKNKYKCSDCLEVEEYDMEFISSTMFEGYNKCGHLFKHEHILKTIPEANRENKYSVTGTALHDLFEKYSKIRPLDAETLDAMLKECVEKYKTINQELFDNELDADNFLMVAKETIHNWHDSEVGRPMPLFTEKQVFLDLHKDLPKIRVTFDRINGNPLKVSEWDVEDYKTGKVYSSDMLQHTMQLPIYAMAIKKEFGELPKTLRFVFPKHVDKMLNVIERRFERITDDIYICDVKRGGTYSISLSQRLEQMIQIYANIKSGIFPYNTKNSVFCNSFCPLGKARKCNGLESKWKDLSRRY